MVNNASYMELIWKYSQIKNGVGKNQRLVSNADTAPYFY